MDDDLLRELAAADPMRGRETTTPDPSAQRALSYALRQGVADPRRSRSWSARAWLVAPALALALVAAAWWVLEPEEVISGIACYQEASLDSSAVVVRSSLLLDGSPESVCAHVWEQARNGGPQPPEGRVTADSLTACVREGGNLVVVPGTGRGPCRDLGWAPASITERTMKLARLDELLNVQWPLRGECSSPMDAEVYARDVLERLELDAEWTIEYRRPTESAGHCSELIFDPQLQVIYVQPGPPRNGGGAIRHG